MNQLYKIFLLTKAILTVGLLYQHTVVAQPDSNYIQEQISNNLAIEPQKFRVEDSLKKNALVQQLTLAELKEIMIKVQEDLQDRLHYLSDNEQETIIKILKEKEIVLKEEITALEATLPTYLHETSLEDMYQMSVTIACGAFTGITLISLFILASYEENSGFNMPSWKRLKECLLS